MNHENQAEQHIKVPPSSIPTDNAIAKLEQQLHEQAQIITSLKVRCFDAENAITAYQRLFNQLIEITDSQNEQELVEFVKAANTN